MLAKLLPDQINAFWPAILEAVRSSLPPTTSGGELRELNIMRALMSDRMTAWVLYGEDGGISGISVCQVCIDPASETRRLEIYSLAALKGRSIPDETYRELEAALIAEAGARRCSMIAFFTGNPHVVELARGFGFEKEFSYMSRRV